MGGDRADADEAAGPIAPRAHRALARGLLDLWLRAHDLELPPEDFAAWSGATKDLLLGLGLEWSADLDDYLIRGPRAEADPIVERCTQIADDVVPEYRCGDRSHSCTGVAAKRWQAAWDGACIALGHDPDSYRQGRIQ